MSRPQIYRYCTVCGERFDMSDEVAQFALNSHEKGHRTMKPDRLLVQRDGLWTCTQCGELFGSSEDMAKLGMISHMKEHGIRPASSSAPDATRDGKGRGGRGFSSSFVENATDFVGDVVEGFVNGLGKILDP